MKKEDVKKWCNKFFIDNDKDFELFDFESEYDEKVSAEENKAQLRAKLKEFLPTIPKTKKEAEIIPKEQYEELVIQEITKAEKQATIEFEKSVKELLKGKNNKEITIKEIFKIPIEYTKSIIGGYHNSFIFLGSQGQGKTTTILKTLEEEKAKYVYHSGISTPKALYEFLYHNRENKTIVFDDCSGLMNNPYALSILLSALWSSTNTRIINWNSTRSAKVSVPSKYIFNSKIIVITNKIPQTDYSDVVLSRCLVYKLELGYKNIIKLMYLMGDKEVVDYIREHSSEATKNFDLRLLKKAEKFKEYDKDNWKELINPLLEVDEYLELIVQGISCSDFIEKTQMSRRSYFRYKQKIFK